MKLYLNRQVDWNGKCKMCPCWHICGHSYENCVNMESHIKASKILMNTKKNQSYLLRQYIKLFKTQLHMF